MYRTLLGDDAKKWTRIATDTDTVDTLKPKAGVLHPQWVEKTYETGPKDARFMQTRAPDVTLVANKDDPSVIDVLAEAKGTSLHDKPQWFGGKEFWIPPGKTYSDEINIVRDANPKWNKKHTVFGYHHQLAPKTRMTQLSFAGHLDNMARRDRPANRGCQGAGEGLIMAELSNQALVIAIQAIDREIRRMRPWVESDESAPEDAMLLEDWERAAEELEQAYDAAAQVALNLPPYEVLVKR